MTHKKLRFTAAGVVFIILVYAIIRLISQFGGMVDEVTAFDEPRTVGGNMCYCMDGLIYVCDPDANNVQIFSADGEFIEGYELPAKGGAVWSGANDTAVYVYAVRSDTLVTFTDGEYIAENTQFTNPDDFSETLGFTVSGARLKGKTVTFADGEYTLDIERYYLTTDWCIVVFALCVIAIFFLTGVLGKMIERAAERASSRYGGKIRR